MIDLWHLTGIDWLRTLPADQTELLRASAVLQSCAPGEVVFGVDPRPDKVYVLESGLIRVFRESPDAEEVTFGYVKPGEIFGESVLFSEQSRDSQAAAVEPSVTLVLDKDRFRAVMKQNPRICCSLIRQIEGRFRDIETRVEDLVFRTARNRLARILLRLANQFGQPDAAGVIVALDLTQKDLAALIGASRPTVNLAMKELEQGGFVVRDGKHIRIADSDGLERALEQL